MEHLDFVSDDIPDVENSFVQIHHEYIGYQSLTDGKITIISISYIWLKFMFLKISPKK